MKKEAVFCDICKEYVPNSESGIVFFKLTDPKVIVERKFEKSICGDICICFNCRDELLNIERFITKTTNNT